MKISMALLVLSCLAASAQDVGIPVDRAALQLSTVAAVSFSTLPFPGLISLQTAATGQFILPTQGFRPGESRADFERRLAEERRAFVEAMALRLKEFDAEQGRLRQAFGQQPFERSVRP